MNAHDDELAELLTRVDGCALYFVAEGSGRGPWWVYNMGYYRTLARGKTLGPLEGAGICGDGPTAREALEMAARLNGDPEAYSRERAAERAAKEANR